MPDRKTKRARTEPTRRTSRSGPMTGSYFLSLELENVRCFSERQTLDLSDGNGRPARWTILLGENGTGKTTILQSLALLDLVVGRIQEVGEQVAHGSPVFVFPATYGAAFTRGDGGYPAYLEAALGHGVGPGSGDRPDRLSFHQIGISSIWGVKYEPSTIEPDAPSCYGYGPSRRSGESKVGKAKGDSTQTLFSDTAALINAEDWLRGLDYSASKPSSIQRQLGRRLEMAKKVLIRILPDVLDIRFSVPAEERVVPDVEFQTPYGWVALGQLGQGYRAMIAWVVDFAARMIDRYPDADDPLAEPAVVLVDEIDLHLHPKWQRDLMGFLTTRFPDTQFIVTAHSPLVVQAAAGANIAVLRREGDHVIIDNHPEMIRGWRVDQVLTSDLFGLETARPPDMERDLLRRKELLTKSRLSKADQKELKEIEQRIGTLPTGESFEQAKTMALIKDSIEFLKKSRGLEP